MITLTLSLELSSLRLVEFSSREGRLVAQREEIRFFSKEASHRQVLTQEIKATLREIKNLWGLSRVPLHCILSSDFALLRVATFEKSSYFIPTTTLVQRDAQQFLPLPLEQVSIAYQKIGRTKHDASRTVAYVAMRTDFLEAITSAIQEAGLRIQKMSMLPLSLHTSLNVLKEIILMNLAEKTVNGFLFSSEKNLCHACFYPLGDCSNAPCDQETGLPLLLIAYLKKYIRSLENSKGLPAICWIINTHSSERKSTALSLLLKKEFSIPSINIDPYILLAGKAKESFIEMLLNKIQLPALICQKENTLSFRKKTAWKHFLRIKHYNISSINKFTAPSITQFQNKQRTLLLIYALAFFLLLFSPLSLVYDYVDSKKIAIEAVKSSICLKEKQLELKQLRQDVEVLSKAEHFEEKLKELQIAHDRWPLLIGELQKCAPPRGMWITQLTPISKEIKENKAHSEISSIEIKGLYLEGVHGEELLHEYADKLAASPLFLRPKKESFILSFSKEDGTAYAYPFTLQLPLCSPIRQ